MAYASHRTAAGLTPCASRSATYCFRCAGMMFRRFCIRVLVSSHSTKRYHATAYRSRVE